MAGLIDSTTGLAFGTGLQFQTQVGTAGLNITTGGPAPPATQMITEASVGMQSESGVDMVTEA